MPGWEPRATLPSGRTDHEARHYIGALLALFGEFYSTCHLLGAAPDHGG